MKLSEIKIAGHEPFVVPLVRNMLKKKEIISLYIQQKDGIKSRLGRITSVWPEEHQVSGKWTFNAITNTESEYDYDEDRLNRSIIKDLSKGRGLIVPARDNPSDLNELTEMSHVDEKYPFDFEIALRTLQKGERKLYLRDAMFEETLKVISQIKIQGDNNFVFTLMDPSYHYGQRDITYTRNNLKHMHLEEEDGKLVLVYNDDYEAD